MGGWEGRSFEGRGWRSRTGLERSWGLSRGAGERGVVATVMSGHARTCSGIAMGFKIV
jgi:hypothetical protein